MGVIKDRHGTYCARKTVPEKPKGLQAAVARVLGNAKAAQKHLKRSLGTKDAREANIRAKPVLAEFDRIIAKAKSTLDQTARPLIKRSTLNAAEITRMAEYVYAKVLAQDDSWRFGGRDELARLGAEHLRVGRRPLQPWQIPFEQWPHRGIPLQVFRDDHETHLEIQQDLRIQAALGDISAVEIYVDEALQVFGIEIDHSSEAYAKLGTACLRAYQRAMDALVKRDEGIEVETPQMVDAQSSAAVEGGGTLRDALDGWKKHRARPARTVSEFTRSIEMFRQLHGNMAVAAIKKKHALDYRRELQEVPRLRKGGLLIATLPVQAAWGREHPDEPKLNAATINKQLGAVQSICLWASDNGLLPDDTQWTDPFSKLRLPEERSERTSFEISELQLLLDTPVFRQHKFPLGARREAGFWLPMLALYSGARQAELGGLTVSNVKADAETETSLLFFVAERARGKRVKTDTSERVVPVHNELVRLGFLRFVEERRRADGEGAWLFPLVAPDRGISGAPAFSKWFGRFLRTAGVIDQAKVFHSFRHTVKDALRRGNADHEIREALIGHAQASSVSWGYGANAMLSRFGAANLSKAVNSISYHGLDLSKVKPF